MRASGIYPITRLIPPEQRIGFGSEALRADDAPVLGHSNVGPMRRLENANALTST
jgi:hypothetical protein